MEDTPDFGIPIQEITSSRVSTACSTRKVSEQDSDKEEFPSFEIDSQANFDFPLLKPVPLRPSSTFRRGPLNRSLANNLT